MLKLLKFRILLVFLILIPFNVFAQTSEDFIKSVTQQASSILMQNISKEQKSQELIEKQQSLHFQQKMFTESQN